MAFLKFGTDYTGKHAEANIRADPQSVCLLYVVG